MNGKKIFALVMAVLLGLGVLSPLLTIMAEATSTPPAVSSDPVQKEINAVTSVKGIYLLSSSDYKQPQSRITRNQERKLVVDVIYYGYSEADRETKAFDSKKPYEFKVNQSAYPDFLSYNSHGAFALKNGASFDAGVTSGIVNTEKNYTIYTVEIPVKYTGKGKDFSFDLRVNTTDVLKCAGSVNVAEEYVEEKFDDDEDEKEPDPVTPYIIVENYTYGGENVVAGNDFTLELTLRNTSEYYSLQNIVMNISTQGVLSMGSSSNTFYIDDLYAGSTMTKKITINAGLNKVTDDKDANSINVKFDFQYLHGNVRKSGNSSENITIPVIFPDRFEVSTPETSGETRVGDEWYIYVPMINKGRSGVYNVTAKIEGESIENAESQTQYMGNINAGTSSGLDFSVRFTEPGEKKGRVIITYEDTNMNPKEVSVPFTVNVLERFVPDFERPMPDTEPNIPVEEETEEDTLPKTPIVVTAIVVCLISAYITVLKAKAKRSIFENEED